MGGSKKFAAIAAFFLIFYFLPEGVGRVPEAAAEAIWMMREYAREHVLLCLIPAFFIAGAISVFISQGAVLKYLGAEAGIAAAYAVASVSGSVLAVCSCTVLPLFAGIYMRGAGLGPAIAFLYSGPAINVLSVTLSARVLGLEMGAARAVFAVLFSVALGLVMAALFRKEEARRLSGFSGAPEGEEALPLWKTVVHVGSMVIFLIFANFAAPKTENAFWQAVYSVKWQTAGAAFLTALASSAFLISKEQREAWLRSAWDYALTVTPLLFAGVLAAGFLLGRPGHEALIPSRWVTALTGGNGVAANVFASVSGALMYFATLTEVPIVEGLMGAGTGKGPALALLLAGPALSLPAMLVISQILGWKKTLAYVALVSVFFASAGIFYGAAF